MTLAVGFFCPPHFVEPSLFNVLGGLAVIGMVLCYMMVMTAASLYGYGERFWELED